MKLVKKDILNIKIAYNYILNHYKKEEIKLAEEYFNNDKYQNLDDFIEKHASEKWKKYKSKIESEYKKNLKKGIIVE